MDHKLTYEDAEQFVAAVAKVKEGQDLYGCGLCAAIYGAGCHEAYGAMSAVVGWVSHLTPGFTRGVWTEDRCNLLAVLQALSVYDVWELVQQWNEEPK